MQGNYEEVYFHQLKQEFSNEIQDLLKFQPAVEIQASHFVSTQIAEVDGKIHVFMVNFKGLKGEEVATQTPETNVKIVFPAKQNAKVFMLPFPGEVQEIKSHGSDGKMTCVISEIHFIYSQPLKVLIRNLN